MKYKFPNGFLSFILSLLLLLNGFKILSQEKERVATLDEKVKTFLDNHRGMWRDMNVPESDGKILYELIIKNNYKIALEIGTSTGHSSIWIGWALSKTGGKLITIEINKERYITAIKNFKDAGLADYIDARLADAHNLVRELEGPFDFVFCDADKGWYKNYFIDIYPKLSEGSCYTAHNVTEWSRSRGSIGEFYNYIIKLPDIHTTIDESGNGISISYKRLTR